MNTFAIKRLFKRFPVWILLALVGASVILFIQNTQKAETANKQMITEVKERLAGRRDLVEKLEKEGQEVDQETKIPLEFLKLEQQDFQKQVDAFAAGEKAYLNWYIEDLGLYAANHKAMALEGGQAVIPTVFQKTREQLLLVRAADAPPMLPLAPLSDFKEIGSMTKKEIGTWQALNQHYYEKGSYHLWRSFSYEEVLILIYGLLICLLGFSAENISSKKKHLNFYRGEGVSLKKVFCSEFIAKLTYWLGASLLVALLILAVTSLINGLGSWQYPVPVNLTAPDTTTFMALWQYLGMSAYLFLLTSLFLIAITVFVESLIGQPVVALIVEIALLTAGLFLTPVIKWNPFSYFHYDQVLRFGFSDNTSLSLLVATLLMVGLSLVLCLGGYFLLKRRMDRN